MVRILNVILSDQELGEGESKDPLSLGKVRKVTDSSTSLPAGSFDQNDNKGGFAMTSRGARAMSITKGLFGRLIAAPTDSIGEML